MIYRPAIYILTSVFMLSCSEESWTDDQKAEFILGCNDEGGKTKYCECFMNNTMEKYPRYEESLEMSFEEAVELSKDCK